MTSFNALTLYQPWASFIAEGVKSFEFRSWPPPNDLIGARLAIHASKRKPIMGELKGLLYKLERGGDAAFGTGMIDRERCVVLLERWIAAPASLPLSSVLCLATVGQPIRNAELAAALGLGHVNDSDRDEHSNWGWPLSDVELLRPFVPAVGQRGLWKWSMPEHLSL